LEQQHRMHPTIADLISRAYYDGEIKSMTIDDQGRPTDKVRHPFVLPSGIAGKAILWLDLPWVQNGGAGEETRHGKYTSTEEVQAITTLLRRLQPCDGHDREIDVAVLSPYKRQVLALTKAMRLLYGPGEKPAWLAPLKDRKQPASTVDAFQGNQAKVVIVSLVRNNPGNLQHPLGFLEEASRMNVLFSRAEQLLVLVGSWDFFHNQLGAIASGHADLGHWRRALDYLTNCFRDGSALLLKASDL
jgi:superfamily I DNA and/or RNA helicase